MIRRPLLNTLCLCGLLLAGCTPKTTEESLNPLNSLATVLAEKTAQLAGAKKQIVIIAPDASWGPMSTAEEAFRAAAKKQGLTVLDTKNINPGDPMKSGTIGLRSADFFETLQKDQAAGAIVSFVGAPLFEPADSAKLQVPHPPIVVVAIARLGITPGIVGSREILTNLVDANMVQLVVLDSEGGGSAGGKADAAHEAFNQHFALLSAAK